MSAETMESLKGLVARDSINWLVDKIRSVPEDDRADLLELFGIVCNATDEEFQEEVESTKLALLEIFTQKPGTLKKL